MKRLMISALAAIALFAAATNMLRSHSPSASPPAGISLQALQTTTDRNKLPIEDIDDQSLVYSKSRQ